MYSAWTKLGDWAGALWASFLLTGPGPAAVRLWALDGARHVAAARRPQHPRKAGADVEGRKQAQATLGSAAARSGSVLAGGSTPGPPRRQRHRIGRLVNVPRHRLYQMLVLDSSGFSLNPHPPTGLPVFTGAASPA